MNSEINNQEKETNIFQVLMFRYYPYWPLFLVLSILMLALAWGYLKITPPVYESTATILIKDEKKGVENSAAIESLNIYTSKKIVENEIEVIRSKTLMQETVEKLNLSAPVYEELLFSSKDAYTSSPVIVEIKDLELIKESEKNAFVFDDNTDQVLLNGVNHPLNKWFASPWGELRFVKNPNLNTEGMGPFYFEIVDPRKVAEGLLKNLKVSPSSKLSTVVNLSIRDQVPEKANQILNTLLENYNKASLNDKNSLAANTLDFVEERIQYVERDLDSIEMVIQNFKSTKGVVDLSEQGKQFLQNVGANDQKLSEINMKLAMLQEIEDYIENPESNSGIVTNTMGTMDQALSEMVSKLYDAENRYQQLKNTTAENNHLMVSIKNQIQSMRPSIRDYVRNQKNSLLASRVKLNITNNQYAGVLQTMPRKERELLEVNRQQFIKNNVYTFLLQKREETALSFASTVGDTRLVDKAQASIKPVAPKKILVFASAIVFAFFLGIAWVMMKEVMSNKLLFRSEIEENTDLRIAGEISHTGLKEYIIIDHPQKPFLTEQFRQLRASLGLYGKNTKRIVMVTSSIAGEGKSFIAVNLATSLANSKKKVLLVDLDLRKPKLTEFYGISGKAGVSEVLNGTELISEVIRSTNNPYLLIMGSGDELSNPTETLLNGDLGLLMTELRHLFDYVIVDTPPVDPVTDGYVISTYCDKSLFIIRHDHTPKSMLKQLDESDNKNFLKNTSILFNNVRSRGLIRNGYGYGKIMGMYKYHNKG